MPYGGGRVPGVLLMRARLFPHARPGQDQSARRRVVSARHCLRSSDRYLSEVRGVSEWIPETLMQRMVACLSGEGDVIVLRKT